MISENGHQWWGCLVSACTVHYCSILLPSLRGFLSIAEEYIGAEQLDPLQTRVSGLEAKETICFSAYFPEELSDTF